jgi:hypothetical protein
MRLYVDKKRPALKDQKVRKNAPGIYFRDISDIRAGTDACHFKDNLNLPENDDKCLYIVASERTLCFELPSKVRVITLMRSRYLKIVSIKFARDWFLERLNLAAEDMLSPEEYNLRLMGRINQVIRSTELTQAQTTEIINFESILRRGLQVLTL